MHNSGYIHEVYSAAKVEFMRSLDTLSLSPERPRSPEIDFAGLVSKQDIVPNPAKRSCHCKHLRSRLSKAEALLAEYSREFKKLKAVIRANKTEYSAKLSQLQLENEQLKATLGAQTGEKHAQDFFLLSMKVEKLEAENNDLKQRVQSQEKRPVNPAKTRKPRQPTRLPRTPARPASRPQSPPLRSTSPSSARSDSPEYRQRNVCERCVRLHKHSWAFQT